MESPTFQEYCLAEFDPGKVLEASGEVFQRHGIGIEELGWSVGTAEELQWP